MSSDILGTPIIYGETAQFFGQGSLKHFIVKKEIKQHK
jgi:hypothetical protein